MHNIALEKEKRRQRIEKRKRKRRKKMLQRAAIMIIGVLFISGIGRMVINIFITENKSVEVMTNDKVDEQSTSEIAEKIEVMTRDDMSKGNLVVVNDTYPLRNYENIELVTIKDHNEELYRVSSSQLKLQKEALEAFNLMIKDFTEEVEKHNLQIISGYRSFDEQEKLHYESLLVNTEKNNNTLVAKPDRSDYHTGLVVDLGLYYADDTNGKYDGSGIYSWITDYCYKYGFIITDNKQPGHLRYIGNVHAGLMKELNLGFDEYIEYIESYRYYANPYQSKEGAGQGYSIYYVPATGDKTQVPVPVSKKYSISGNNKDGFIITVTL